MLRTVAALLLPLASRALDDASACVQASVHGHDGARPSRGSKLNEVVRDAFGMFEEQARAQAGTPDPAILELAAQEPEDKPPVEHGVIFEREVVSMENGASGEMSIDHGCTEKDRYGDNMCEFAHGDTLHVRMEYRLANPINSGYFVINGQPELLGLAGILKNAKEGRRRNFISRMNPMNVECKICGATCEADLFGKHKSFEMPLCPVPGNQTVTLLDVDITLPGGDFLPLAQGRLHTDFVIRRTENERDDIVSTVHALFQMSRIHKGMPPLQRLM